MNQFKSPRQHILIKYPEAIVIKNDMSEWYKVYSTNDTTRIVLGQGCSKRAAWRSAFKNYIS